MRKSLSVLLALCLLLSGTVPLEAAPRARLAPELAPAPAVAPGLALPALPTPLPEAAQALSSALPSAPLGVPHIPSSPGTAGFRPPAAPALENPDSAARLADRASAVLADAPAPAAQGPEQAADFGARLLEETAPAPSLGEAAPLAAAPAAAPSLGAPNIPSSPGTAGSRPPAPPPAADRPFFVRHPRLLRAILDPVVWLLYRVRVSGRENLPSGPALIVANHASWVDWLFVIHAARRPLRFMMFKPIYEGWGLKWLFKAAGAIPVASGDDPKKTEEAIQRARAALLDGQSVVILPEGAITHNGNMKGFRRGFERIAEGTGVPVVPGHLDGLWGSVFSRRTGRTLGDHFREGRRTVRVRFGAAQAKADAKAARDAVSELGAESLSARINEGSRPLALSFLDAAKRFWKRPAVADSTGQDLTYGRTLAGTVLLAGLLKSRLPQGPNVGVLLPPSAGGALANLALAGLGKTAVNLNYTASAEALAHAVSSAGLGVIVTSRKFLDALKEKKAALPQAPMLFLEDLLPLVPKWKKTLVYLALRLLPKSLIAAAMLRGASRDLGDNATILFTSGSSALPKGVELTHANIQANVEMVRSAFPLRAGDKVLGVLPFFHSFGYTVTLWLPLLTGLGAAYHTHPLETDAIAKLAAKTKPTMLLGTPTFLQRYALKVPAEAFAALRLVVAGAEKLRGSIADDFEKKFGARPLEGYGATELSPVAAVNLPDVGPQKGSLAGSVGQPLPGSAARVVDPETLKPLPYGERGMLLIKGPHVMKGYLGEPAKTAQVLKDGWYVTGDLAVMDREGFITLAGRQTRFSKIAGEMISHVAVEEKLHQAAGLSEQVFVVTGVPDERRGERLVVLHAGYAGSIEELLSKAQSLGLPGLWTPLPSSFYKIDAIPVLGTGKLDLKAINELALKLAAKP